MAGPTGAVVATPIAQRDLGDRLAALLPDCRPETIRALATSAKLRRLRPGDVIYAQGELVPLTFILEGFGIAQRTTDNGHQLLSGVAQAGVLFGYSGIAARHSSVEMIAITDCFVAQWSGTAVRALAAVDPSFALAAIDSMAASLHVVIEQIEGYLHQDARRRVLRILARYRALFFDEPAILNRTHLAGLVGTSPEMTRRVLRQLEQEGTVRRVGRLGLELLDPARLLGA
jgi:CRP/FNR family transcriptional regulator, anaerobic regulatory protein